VSQQLLLAFIAIFVALDIVGALPMYVGMTAAMTERERGRVLDVSMLVAFLTALAFAIAGLKLFSALGITVSDFKIAGGIVLLLLSLADLVGHSEAENRASGSTGIVPLAVPLITGPAVLTTLVLQIRQAGYLPTLLALFANYALAWMILRKSDFVTKTIGKDGTVVFSKIAALLLAAIAVSMIRGGVFEAAVLFRSYS
jgi:multiple antibiotic resistance protein